MKAYFYLAIALLAAGCSQTETQYVARVKLQKLSEADLYNSEMVYDVIFDAQELKADSLRNQSRQLFLKGIDLYKNRKDAAGAVKLFKQSILMFPEAKTYYELGNALLDAKGGSESLKEADKAFDVAQYLNFKPASMLYYKMAVVKSLRMRSDPDMGVYSVVNNLSDAFQSGYSDTAALLKDEAFANVIHTPEFGEMMLNLKTKEVKEDAGSLFALFKNSFQEYKQPFAITFDDLDKNNRQSISYDFARFVPEMQNVSFGRDVSHDFFYVGKIAETPEYTAVIYSSISFWEQDMQPVNTKLVTYDKNGKIIASKLFAGQFSAEKVKTGKINNNEIVLQDYKRIWKSPIDQVPFSDNEVLKYELVATATFKLTDAGQIVEVSVPANYSDSVVFAKK